jgi:hypothetical protein
MIHSFDDYINEEIYFNKNLKGAHNILYLHGSRGELSNDEFKKVNVSRRNQNMYNVLSQFGDNVYWPPLYYHGGDMIFDEMEEMIQEKNIDILIGNSAGGYVSFYLSNKYGLPNLSINPAMAESSEAPTLQYMKILFDEINGNQIVVIGEDDSKANGGVDGQEVIKLLKIMEFEQVGGEIITLPGVRHRLEPKTFNEVFRYFYKKCVK